MASDPKDAKFAALKIGRWVVLFVYGFVVVSVTILGIAFFLRLFNANVTAPFVEWIYRSAAVIMQPFRGIFPPVEGQNGSVLDVSLLFAMLMYSLFGIVVHNLVDYLDRRLRRSRAEAYASAPPAGARPPSV